MPTIFMTKNSQKSVQKKLKTKTQEIYYTDSHSC